VTVLDAGDRINVIPSEARALLDVRLLPDTDEQAFLLEVERALGDGVDVRLLLTSPRSAPSPIDSFGYRTVERVLGGEAPVVPAFINGFTDSRYFRERGIPAYGVSPFVLEPQEMLTIHGADERIPLIELERGVERMKRIVLALATS
jgi:acetylornithine deacetylase/succinyl-diaminopimelate desuccinylase-like protein